MSSHRFVRREQRQAEAEPGQVKRYWPGRAPDWYKEDKDEEVEEQSEDEAGPAAFGKLAVEDGPAFGAVAAPSIVKKADPRLQRLQQAQKAGSDEPRQIAVAQVVSRRRHGTPSDSEEEAGSGADRDGADSDDEDGPEAPARAESDPEEDADALARRAALRARLQASAAQEEQLIQAPGDDLESEESSGEYETDSEDDTRQLLKPTFTHARDRETIAERERLEKEEQRKEADKQRQLELRKADTHNLVIDQLRIEDAAVRAAKAGPKEIGDVDTDDDMDEAAEQQEYELWKSREMARIRRNKEVREKADAAEEEREMLKHMNEEERRQWERDNPKEAHLGNKQKWRFLQKYWHKGAYFQDASDNAFIADRADDIFDRDYSMPTGEDKLDKTVLPKVMQVKNFGRRGRTKYTHLVDQDTTDFTDPSAQDVSLRHKRRLAGTDLEFSRPKALRT